VSALDHLSEPQFYHGTHREFAPGDTLTPPSVGGHKMAHPERSSGHHVYISTDPKEAHSYASLAAMRHGGKARVYQVDPHRTASGRAVVMPDQNSIDDHDSRLAAFNTAHITGKAKVIREHKL
jgi:hypothetical protein